MSLNLRDQATTAIAGEQQPSATDAALEGAMLANHVDPVQVIPNPDEIPPTPTPADDRLEGQRPDPDLPVLTQAVNPNEQQPSSSDLCLEEQRLP